MKRFALLGAASAALLSTSSAFAQAATTLAAPTALGWATAIDGTGVGISEFEPVLVAAAAVVITVTLTMVGITFVRKVIRKVG